MFIPPTKYSESEVIADASASWTDSVLAVIDAPPQMKFLVLGATDEEFARGLEFGLFGRWSGEEYVFGLTSMYPFCGLVVGVGDQVTPEQITQHAMAKETGPCLWPTRYGVPGPGIMEWYLERGHRMGLAPSIVQLENDPFAMAGHVSSSFRHPTQDGCLSGNRQMCRLFFEEGIKLSSRGDVIVATHRALPEAIRNNWYRPNSPGFIAGLYRYEFAMLSELERQFGRDRFERFWKSDRTVTVAFRDAFGIDPGDWTYEWAHHVLGGTADITVGPQPGVMTASISLLLFLTCAGIGIKLRS